jgi:hypothetical protein
VKTIWFVAGKQLRTALINFSLDWVFSTPAPIKALPCLSFFPPTAEKSKPPALRAIGDALYKIFNFNLQSAMVIR